jgi:hypothetical protein
MGQQRRCGVALRQDLRRLLSQLDMAFAAWAGIFKPNVAQDLNPGRNIVDLLRLDGEGTLMNITHGLRLACRSTLAALLRSSKAVTVRGGKLVTECHALRRRCAAMDLVGVTASPC